MFVFDKIKMVFDSVDRDRLDELIHQAAMGAARRIDEEQLFPERFAGAQYDRAVQRQADHKEMDDRLVEANAQPDYWYSCW